MNEAETRAELIDPKLTHNGWGVAENSKILWERNDCKISETFIYKQSSIIK